MTEFTLDTSGAVIVPGMQRFGRHGRPVLGPDAYTWTWSDLSPFEQGYVEAVFASLSGADRLRTYGWKIGDRDPRVNTDFAGRFMVCEPYEECELPTRDGRDGPWCIVGDELDVLIAEAVRLWPPTDLPAHFSNLAAETLAAIRKDCAAWESADRLSADDGREFWHWRVAGDLIDKGFPPLTPYLSDDGKVCLR